MDAYIEWFRVAAGVAVADARIRMDAYRAHITVVKAKVYENAEQRRVEEIIKKIMAD